MYLGQALSDVNVYVRGQPVWRNATEPEHPLARLEPGVMHSETRFQDMACAHCQRQRQDTVWRYRCGKCAGTVLFCGCLDCGGAQGARDRYDQHVEAMHGV